MSLIFHNLWLLRHQAMHPQCLLYGMTPGAAGAGIVNYSIWNTGDELFGYFECTEGVAHAEAVQAGSVVVDKWNVYMQDVMVMIMAPVTGAQPKMTQVFNLD